MQLITGRLSAEVGRSTDQSASSNDSVVDSVLMALMAVGRLMRSRVDGDDMDPGSLWLLKTLAFAPLRVTELAESAGLDPSTVSRHVAQLDRSGLVERTPDPADGRAHRLELTPEGRTRLDEAFRRRRALLSRSLSGWDSADIERLGRLLSRFVDDIKQVPTDLERA
jgi:DNA-binding MarR family transcriptional regulator